MASVADSQDARHFGGTGTKNNLVDRLLATERTTGTDKGLFGASDPSFDGAFRQGLALAALAVTHVAKTDPRDHRRDRVAHETTVRERALRGVPQDAVGPVRAREPDDVHRPRHEQHRVRSRRTRGVGPVPSPVVGDRLTRGDPVERRGIPFRRREGSGTGPQLDRVGDPSARGRAELTEPEPMEEGGEFAVHGVAELPDRLHEP